MPWPRGCGAGARVLALLTLTLQTAVLADDPRIPTTSPRSASSSRAPPPRGPAGPLPGSVTCGTVEQAGSAAALPAASLRALQPQQASSCIALLGKDPLAEDQARAIWDLLLQTYETADTVPDDTLRLLGWVSGGIPPDHLVNLSLSEIDTVAALGVFHNLSLDQLTALAETVRFQWSAKEPEDLTNLDLAALNHILCGFNASDLVRVHAAAYKDAASSLSLLRCPGMPGAAPVPGVGAPGEDSGGGSGGSGDAVTLPGLPSLRALAALALSGDAFGDPGGWSAGTVRAIGCVLVGLPTAAVSRVPTASMHAMLQALAGSEQAVIRRCLYGTPVIAQRLASSDQPQSATSASIAVPTESTTGTSTTAMASNGTATNATMAGVAEGARGQSATRRGQQGSGNGSCAEKRARVYDVLLLFMTVSSSFIVLNYGT